MSVDVRHGTLCERLLPGERLRAAVVRGYCGIRHFTPHPSATPPPSPEGEGSRLSFCNRSINQNMNDKLGLIGAFENCKRFQISSWLQFRRNSKSVGEVQARNPQSSQARFGEPLGSSRSKAFVSSLAIRAL